jgi:two-component system NtrC family response regulator
MAHVLIIDDDDFFNKMLSHLVKSQGHEATSALTLQDGLQTATTGRFDVVFLDVRLPDGSGLEVLPKIREIPSPPEVIIITGSGDPDGAELAIKNGAWDYIEKVFSIERITLSLVRALEYREGKKARKPVALKLAGIIGGGPKMRACFDLLAQAANSEANVLLQGETGTGKELFAQAIHANSPRAAKNFVVVDCAALPENLIESALFGHEKGAFTGADKAQAGLVKQADGGTLFLDEVGELPPLMQKAFLRVLQERRFRPLGGREQDSDFRLVAATNRDLQQMVDSGQFRNDLLFRLQAISIILPPLRELKEDIREISLYHLDRLCKKYGLSPKGFSPEFFGALEAYDWPGNVRELINTLDKALAEARFDPVLFPRHLPMHLRVMVTRAAINDHKGIQAHSPLEETTSHYQLLPSLKDFREAAVAEAEKQYLRDLMVAVKGDVQEACRISKLGQARIYGLLRKYKISRQM